MVVIVVVASVMMFTYSTGLLNALLVAPKTATESISLEYSYFSSSNNAATLFVRNTGSTPITLNGYWVRDSSGNLYAKANWIGPTFAPTNLANATSGLNILISSACTGCTNTGTAFTFQQGNPYTVTLLTTKNGQFSFTIVR